MKIGIVSTHSWPVPSKAHTGDHFYAGLARTLDEMGHEVYFFAPDGSYVPPHGKQLTMPCTFGNDPTVTAPRDCEQACFMQYADILRSLDIVHDFSIGKIIIRRLQSEGFKNNIITPLGGDWRNIHNLSNIVVSSEAMKQRGLRGATDYENTPFPNQAGPPQTPIKGAHVVYYGIDTDFYTPTYKKGNYFLWLGRWHTIRGYHLAIQLAKETGAEIVMAGEHPDREVSAYQKACSLEAVRLAADLPNIHFEWLPADPYHHEAKRELIQGAKALLFPVQFQEPFGLMQPEALACGTPVIATNFGSVPEIISHGSTGFIVDNTVQGFAQALDLVNDIQPAICRSHAVNRFDRHIMAKNYLKEYELVMNGVTW